MVNIHQYFLVRRIGFTMWSKGKKPSKMILFRVEVPITGLHFVCMSPWELNCPCIISKLRSGFQKSAPLFLYIEDIR